VRMICLRISSEAMTKAMTRLGFVHHCFKSDMRLANSSWIEECTEMVCGCSFRWIHDTPSEQVERMAWQVIRGGVLGLSLIRTGSASEELLKADTFGVDEALEAAVRCFAHKLPSVFSVNASA